MSQPLRAILFDLGDTLLDFGHLKVRELFRAGAEYAYDYTKAQGGTLPSFESYFRRHYRAIRWNVVKNKLLGRDFSARDVMARFAPRYLPHVSDAQLMELCAKFYQPLRDLATVEPGLADMLTGLRDRGLTLGIISNTFVPGEILDRHIEAEGLMEFFPLRIYSCDVGVPKPNRRIFQVALDAIDLPAEQVMFVGDSPTTDICGARRMGMISVLKDRLKRPIGRHTPDHTITDVIDLPKIVDLLGERAEG